MQCVIDGKIVNFTKKDQIGEGEEGKVYRVGNTIIKKHKLTILKKSTCKYLIRINSSSMQIVLPYDLALNKSGKYIGYVTRDLGDNKGIDRIKEFTKEELNDNYDTLIKDGITLAKKGVSLGDITKDNMFVNDKIYFPDCGLFEIMDPKEDFEYLITHNTFLIDSIFENILFGFIIDETKTIDSKLMNYFKKNSTFTRCFVDYMTPSETVGQYVKRINESRNK